MITRLRYQIINRQVPDCLVADAAGVSRPRVAEYATGVRCIPSHHLAALAEVLGVHPQELVGWCDETILV